MDASCLVRASLLFTEIASSDLPRVRFNAFNFPFRSASFASMVHRFHLTKVFILFDLWITNTVLFVSRRRCHYVRDYFLVSPNICRTSVTNPQSVFSIGFIHIVCRPQFTPQQLLYKSCNHLTRKLSDIPLCLSVNSYWLLFYYYR